MQVFARITTAVAVVAWLTSCGFELSVPERPLRGDASGTVDTGGHVPPGNLEVLLVAESGGSLSQRTDTAGAFVFADLQPGAYFIQLNIPGFAPFIRPNVRVKAGQIADLGTLAPTWLENTPDEATLAGKVIVEGGGGNTNGGQVEFIIEGINKRLALVAIGSSGDFVQRLPPGTYTLVASHPLYVSRTVTGVVLTPSESRDLTAQPLALGVNPATVVGVVMKEVDGKPSVPASGAAITVEGSGATTTTDSAGRFSLAGLPAGALSLRVSLTDFHDPEPTHALTLAPGATATLATVTLQLDRGDVKGEVRTNDGQAVQDAVVTLVGLPYGAVVSPDSADVSKGTFKITGVPVGTWTVTASMARYARATASNVVVAKGAAVDIGTLVLAILQGDFDIDDGDATNVAGYARSTAVTLKLNNFAGAATFRASEDPAFTGVAFQAFTGTSQPFTLQSAQGTHRIYAQYEDAMATRSATFSSSIVLDSVAPSTPAIAINGGALFTNLPSPLSLTLTANESVPAGVDAVSGLGAVRLSESAAVDGQGNLSAPKQTYLRDLPFVPSTLTDGVKSVFAQFVDNAGNASAVVGATIAVDTQKPTGSIAIARGARATVDGYTSQPLVQLTVTTGSEPDGGTVQIRLANSSSALTTAVLSPVQQSQSWFLDPSTEGLKTVYAQLQDSASNASLPINASIVYDITPPSPVSASIVGNPTDTNQAALTLQVSASDTSGLSPTQALTASEDALFQTSGTVGPQAMPGTGQLPFTLSSGDGQKRVYLRFRDVAGNESTTSVTVNYDTTAPSGAFVIAGALADGTASTELTATTSVSLQLTQTGAIRYALGNESMTSCPTSVAAYTALPAGAISATLSGSASPRKVTLCLRDAAGNVGGPFEDTIALDSAAPSGCTVSLEAERAGLWVANGYTASQNLRARVASCAETPTEMAIAVDSTPTCSGAGNTWVPFASLPTVTIPTATEVSHSVTLCVRDVARNAAAIGPSAIVLDKTAPNVVSATLAQGAYTNLASVTVNLSATDSNGLSHTDALTVSEDVFFTSGPTVGPQALAASVPFALSTADGEKSLYVRLRDRAGNESFASLAITRDTAAPSGSIVIEGKLADGTPSTAYATPFGGNPPPVTVYLTHSGATQVALGATTLNCASATYSALTSTTLSTTLSVSGATGSVGVCLKDAAGNTAGPLTDTITFESAGPTGCGLTLIGTLADGVNNAPAGLTAKPVIRAVVSSCVNATDVYLVNGAASCSATASASWTGYSSTVTIPFLLSSGDGVNSVSGCARTAARNVSALPTTNITLDSTPPSALSVVINNDAPYFNASQLTGGVISTTVVGSAVGATQWALSEGQTFTFSPFTGASTSFSLGDAGTRTLFARFSDDLGNLSGVVSDTIEVDLTAPSVATSLVRISSANDAGYVNNNSVTLAATAPGDAVTVQLGEDTAPAGCAPADVSGSTLDPISTNYSFVLSSGDGAKVVCARWYDAAGNPSAFKSGGATLDTTPPLQPLIFTPDKIFNPFASGNSLSQDVAVASTTQDSQHKAWQLLGGALGVWTTVTPGSAGGNLKFTFALRWDAQAEQGLPNVLKVREVDLADNVGPEATVVLTTDVVPPKAVDLNNLWTDNRSGSAVVRWTRSVSADVTGYNVYYGAATGNAGGLSDGGSVLSDGGIVLPSGYYGLYADQGSSPVKMGNVDYATLTGLPNNSLTYVTVRPVDRAGNIGAGPPQQPTEVTLQPNIVSPNLLMDFSVLADGGTTGGVSATSVAVEGDYAYVFGSTNAGVCALGNTLIQPVSLAYIISQVQGGQIIPGAQPIPQTFAPVKTSDGQCNSTLAGDMVVEYPFIFTAAGDHFRVWSLYNTTVPTPIVDMLLTPIVAGPLHLNAIDVRGGHAFVAGNNVLFDIDVSSLYDESSLTRPVAPTSGIIPGSVLGWSTIAQASAVNMTWTRDRLLLGHAAAGSADSAYDIAVSFDGVGSTNLANGSEFPSAINFDPLRGRATVSGNIGMIMEQDGLHLYNVAQVWSKVSPYLVEKSTIPSIGYGQFQVAGSQVFASERVNSGILSVEAANITSLVDTGTTRATAFAGASGMGLFGNYAIQSTEATAVGSTRMRVYELAVPRGLRRVTSLVEPIGKIIVKPGLVYGSSGAILDLLSGSTPARLAIPTAAEWCKYDAAVFDDTVVSSNDFAGQNALRITRTEDAVARTGAAFNITSNSSTYTMPANTRVVGMDRVGNYLILATARSGSPTTLWLEAYKASALRSTTTNQARTLTAADKVSEFQYATTAISWTAVKPFVRVTNGIAVVTTSSGIYMVDIKAMLDDNAATAMSAASVQGLVTGISATDALLRGEYLYVTGSHNTYGQGLFLIFASAAYDSSSASTVSFSDMETFVPVPYGNSVAAYGSYVLVASYNVNSGGVTAFDVSNPGSPAQIGQMPFPYGNLSFCGPGKTSMEIQGTRVYIGSQERFDIVELE